MEFRDLQRQYQKLKPAIDAEIQNVLDSSKYISGPQVAELEQELAEYVGVKHCIACANGTDALTMAMMAWEMGEGDAVFVPDFTFFSSGEIVSHAGATPVFVDVDVDTFNISPASLETMIRKTIEKGELNPKAIVAVDLFGLPADYNAIKTIAKKYNLLLLEDGAQGFGGSIDGKMACSFGDISTTSFFPSKPLGCYGDGGAVFTDDDNYAEALKSIRVHGKGSDKYDNIRIGLNSRLDTIQAAILKVKLKAFREYEVDAVNKVALAYTEVLKEVVGTPIVPQGYLSSWAQYTIKLKDKSERDALQKHLNENDIPTSIFYKKPMHEQKAFVIDINDRNDLYSNTIKLSDTVLSLPMHPYLENDEIEKVRDNIFRGLENLK